MTAPFDPDAAAERWRLTEELFNAVLALPPEERAAYLLAATADDEAMRREVESLLAADADPPPLLERSLGSLPALPTGASLDLRTGAHAVIPARPSLSAGQRLGSYRVIRQLGHGGMSAVYLARHEETGEDVALKVVARRQPVPRFAERFAREIRLARRLRHPNVLPLLDEGETEELLWLTMPHVPGGSLRDRVRREERLPLDEVRRIARDVAAGLAYAHGEGVVHRDVKPENVLLAEPGPADAGHGRAMLADFGISRALDPDDPDAKRITGTGVRLGTPAYMSPEQVLGDPIDHRTDVYSLACLLFELLVGRPPFAEGSTWGAIGRRLNEPAPNVRLLRPEVPAAMADALRRALARDPRARTATASELARGFGVGA